MNTSFSRWGFIFLLAGLSSQIHGLGRCDDIANPRQRLQCTRDEHERTAQPVELQQRDAKSGPIRSPRPTTTDATSSGETSALSSDVRSGAVRSQRGIAEDAASRVTGRGTPGELSSGPIRSQRSIAAETMGLNETARPLGNGRVDPVRSQRPIVSGAGNTGGIAGSTNDLSSNPVRSSLGQSQAATAVQRGTAARQSARGSVSGKVHKNSESGPALDLATVIVGGKRANTTRDGTFRIEGLAAGNASVVLSKSGFNTYERTVTIVAGKNVDIGQRWLVENLTPAPSIEGQLNAREHAVRAQIPSTDDAGFGGVDPDVLPLPDNTIGLGYCTDYAERIFRAITGAGNISWGHAKDWYKKGGGAGWKTLGRKEIAKAPAGAMIVWDDGGFGHVGIVVRNDGNRILVTEANFALLNRKFPEKWLSANPVTLSFNKHIENDLPYANAKNRGRYSLIGFVLPEKSK